MRPTLFCCWLAIATTLLCWMVGDTHAQADDDGAQRDRPAARERADGRGPNPARRGRARPAGASSGKDVAVLTDPTGLIPLTDMGEQTHNGLDGGLYGNGENQPPEAHQALARQALARIEPLDADGKPAADGKVVLTAVGMSNTAMEFIAFKAVADEHPLKADHVEIVDTAQGGRTAGAWATSGRGSTRRSLVPVQGEDYKGEPGEERIDERQPGDGHTVWDESDRRIRGAGLTPAQVQVVWIKVAGSTKLGFPDHIEQYQGHLETIVQLAREHYPNLQIAYLSSRIYAGYATTPLNPEPWSYESAFGVRGLIQQQIDGDPAVNADATRGPVTAPVLLWGPYLWADGTKPREADGLIWERGDLARDGTHPTTTGTAKVAELLVGYFTTDPLARPWFVGEAAGDE
ncbi:MAG: hypothetical protein WD118_08865 [Phycisphaeraceae bacterium]